MLAKKHRLTDTNDFKKVQKEGKVFQSADFGIAFFDRQDDDPSRFGFVVSTKISKDASDRNRIRRAMSEAVRTSALDIKNGLDIVFLAKLSVARSPTDKIMRDVKSALKEGGLTK